jgi:GH15 family glucan-1,4-alpha-glucosidase
LFNRILDEKTGGHFSIRPEKAFTLETSYLPNTLILKSKFTTADGNLTLTDFMPLGVPSIIRMFDSEIPFVVEIAPNFDMAMTRPSIEERDSGYIFKNVKTSESFEVRLSGTYERLGRGRARFSPGSGHILSIYFRNFNYGLFSKKGFVYPYPKEALHLTTDYWESQVSSARSVSMYSEAYYRSISVILGLMYLPSGGLIAAPTSSLPEVIGKGRNWDYRYVWIRDASYAIEALTNAGLHTKAARALSFLISVVDPSSKSFDHPLFQIDGTAPPPEEELGWLDGYKASKPVRTGNAAYQQIQMDCEGAFMDAFYQYVLKSKDVNYLRENMWAVRSIVKWTIGAWRLDGTSLWEEREANHHFVHSKVMSWVAMDRAAKMAHMLGHTEEANAWQAEAHLIRDDVMSNGISRKFGGFSKYYGAESVDSALLLLPLYGFVDANDPVFTATLKKVETDLLLKSGLLIRYESDSMGRVMNPFSLLNTWLSRVYTMRGEFGKASRALDVMISYSTDLLLFSEHVDSETREPLGNFPQLFPHAGLVEALLEYEDAVKAKKD